MSISDLAIVAALIFAWGAVSARMERLDVTSPIVFVIAGLVLTHGPLAVLGFAPSHEELKILAEATLVLVLFSDASRVGLRDLRAREPGLEVIVLLRGRNELAAPLLSLLGLDVPVVTGSPALYARYNVRVGPFAILVDAAGQVRASSLVNHDWQIAKLHQLASIPVDFPTRSADRRLRRAALEAV